MANILDIVKEVEKPLLSPQESFFIGSPSYKEAAKETKKAKIETMEKSILDVFEEKSRDADDAIEYGMGLSTEELLDIAMSVTPIGGVKAGKGAISFLKGLLGRAKSKAKFPVGYGESTKNIAKGKAELSEFFELKKLNQALERLSNPEKYSKLQTLPWGREFKAGKELSGRMELQKSLSKGRPVKPLTKQEYNEIIKGMRKIGIKVKD